MFFELFPTLNPWPTTDLTQNHIVHHLLTLFALGASPAELKKGYDDNASYQRSVGKLERAVVDDMHDPERFKTYLGKENYYYDFLVFFQGEIDKKGWEEVLNEYFFKGDDKADDMLVRLYSGRLTTRKAQGKLTHGQDSSIPSFTSDSESSSSNLPS